MTEKIFNDNVNEKNGDRRSIVRASIDKIRLIYSLVKEKLKISDLEAIARIDDVIVEIAETRETVNDAETALVEGALEATGAVETSGINPIDSLESDGYSALVTSAVEDLASSGAVLPNNQPVADVVIKHIESSDRFSGANEQPENPIDNPNADAGSDDKVVKSAHHPIDPSKQYKKGWKPDGRYTMDLAQKEAEIISIIKEYDRSGRGYDELANEAEVDMLTERISAPDYEEVVEAVANTEEFSEEQQEELNEQRARLDDPVGFEVVVKRLKEEGVANENIILFLQEAMNAHEFKPIIHRAKMFSEKSRKMREQLGIDIDISSRPERYLYHGMKGGFPKLTEDELVSYMDKGLIGSQMGGVSTWVGNKGLATTMTLTMSGYGGPDMFRIDADQLKSDGYEIDYHYDTENPVAYIQLPNGGAIPPEYIEYRVDDLGIYVPLSRLDEVRTLLAANTDN
jgi:hypothetical protein